MSNVAGRFFRPFIKVCSFGDTAYPSEDVEQYEFESPSVLDTDAARLSSDSLMQRLSTAYGQQPFIVDRYEATVNMAALQGTAAPQATVNPGMMSRRKSMAPQRMEAGIEWTESRKLLEVAIAVEQQQPTTDPSMAYREDVAAQERRLVTRLSSLGLDMAVQLGDGNCQFRSLSYGLYGTSVHHEYVRKAVVDYMQRRRGDFEAFLGEEFKAYVRSMARDGVWGDELTLRAACESLGVVVNVVTSDTDNWFLRYIPQHTLVKHEVFLSYVAPVHYNAICRRPRGAAPILRSMSSLGRRNSRILAALDEYERTNAVPETPQNLVYA